MIPRGLHRLTKHLFDFGAEGGEFGFPVSEFVPFGAFHRLFCPKNLTGGGV
jgi:hypothetical protein